MDVADLDGDKAPEVLYVSRTQSGGSDAYRAPGPEAREAGTFLPFRWGQEDDVPLRGVSNAPPAIRVLDVNRDGQADVLVFNASGPPLAPARPPPASPPPPPGAASGRWPGSRPPA